MADRIKDVIDSIHPLSARGADAAEEAPRQAQSGAEYFSIPFREMGAEGEYLKAGRTLWLHCRVSWYWDFFSYSSDSWAWVTDAAAADSNKVAVQEISAYLRHTSAYGSQQDTRQNSSIAHAFVRVSGIGVSKAGVCGHSCAKEPGFGSWCTRESCAN